MCFCNSLGNIAVLMVFFLQLTRSRLHILVELKKLVRFMLKAHFNVILISNFVTIFYTIILQFYFSFSRQSYFQGLL